MIFLDGYFRFFIISLHEIFEVRTVSLRGATYDKFLTIKLL